MTVVDEDALVAAIRADPDSDGPRMVYADWLQQRGDPLGEYIALRMAAERTAPGDAQLGALWARINELGVGARWHDAFRAYERTERGMIAHVSLAADKLVPALLDQLRGSMIRDLTLESGPATDEQLAVLARAVQRMAVRGLRVGMYLSTVQQARLWSWLPGVERLWLWETSLSDAGARALAAAPLGRLAELNATYFAGPVRTASLLGDDGAIALAESTSLTALHDVTLRLWRITGRGAAALVDGALPLDALDVSGNPLGATGAVDLVRPAGTARLRSLGLAGVGLDDDAAAALAAAPQLANLRRLVLSDRWMASGLTATGVAALVASPHLSRELELVIDGTALGLRVGCGYDGMSGQITNTWWEGEPPAAVAQRFRVKVEGYAPEPPG